MAESTAASPDHWLGAFVMASARAHRWLREDKPAKAQAELENVLARFGDSPLLTIDLLLELAPYWVPDKEETK